MNGSTFFFFLAFLQLFCAQTEHGSILLQQELEQKGEDSNLLARFNDTENSFLAEHISQKH